MEFLSCVQITPYYWLYVNFIIITTRENKIDTKKQTESKRGLDREVSQMRRQVS